MAFLYQGSLEYLRNNIKNSLKSNSLKKWVQQVCWLKKQTERLDSM